MKMAIQTNRRRAPVLGQTEISENNKIRVQKTQIPLEASLVNHRVIDYTCVLIRNCDLILKINMDYMYLLNIIPIACVISIHKIFVILVGQHS